MCIRDSFVAGVVARVDRLLSAPEVEEPSQEDTELVRVAPGERIIMLGGGKFCVIPEAPAIPAEFTAAPIF
eukprot:10011381-Alexandrium_andersonii.AAC.1